MNDEDKPLNQQGQESHLSDPSVGGEIFFELRGTKLKLKFSRGGKSRSCSKYKKFDKSSADEHPHNVSEMCQASNSRNVQRLFQRTLHHINAADQPNVPHQIKCILVH